MFTVIVKSGYNGQKFRIDAADEDMARQWLWDLVKAMPPHGIGTDDLIIEVLNQTDARLRADSGAAR
jgi:hypothetical protein